MSRLRSYAAHPVQATATFQTVNADAMRAQLRRRRLEVNHKRGSPSWETSGTKEASRPSRRNSCVQAARPDCVDSALKAREHCQVPASVSQLLQGTLTVAANESLGRDKADERVLLGLDVRCGRIAEREAEPLWSIRTQHRSWG